MNGGQSPPQVMQGQMQGGQGQAAPSGGADDDLFTAANVANHAPTAGGFNWRGR